MNTPAALLVMDLGGVMCQWLPERRIQALAELSGLPTATVDALVFESGFDDAADRGQFTLEQVRHELCALLGLADDPAHADLVQAAWSQAFEPSPPVMELVAKARATVPTTLFTNNGPMLQANLAHELQTVGDLFDRLIFSWHLGTTKPDGGAFARATDLLEIDPGAVFFVDDNPANVAAAQAAGWQAHHYRDTLNLRAALTEAGLLGR